MDNKIGFWGRLFCRHLFKRITEWHKVKTIFGDTDYYRVAVFHCQKCGKYKQKKLNRYV